MPDFSQLYSRGTKSVIAGFSAGAGTNIPTASGSANTKGSWVNLLDPIPFTTDFIEIEVHSIDSAPRPYLIDIGIADSGGGNEVVVIPNLFYFGLDTIIRHPLVAFFPLTLPKGKRLVARASVNHATQHNIVVSVRLSASGFRPSKSLTKCAVFNITEASTAITTTLDPGGTANTKGSWAELSSSLAHSIHGLVVLPYGDNGNSALTDAKIRLDFGIGSGGSEVVIVPDLMFWEMAFNDTYMPQSIFVPCSIPKGQRFAMRMQSSITDATDRLTDFAVYGIY